MSPVRGRSRSHSPRPRQNRSRSPRRDKRYDESNRRRGRSRSRSRSPPNDSRIREPYRSRNSQSRSGSRTRRRRYSSSRSRSPRRDRKLRSTSRDGGRGRDGERSLRKRSRSRSRSRSASSSHSSSSDRRRRKHRKEKHRKKHGSQEKKEKKKSKKTKKKAGGGDKPHWGKYGIISETDMYNKAAEFHTWLVEERKINPETVSKDQSKKEFSRFVEDYNTATLPHEKYYNMEAYDRRMSALRSGEFVPPPDDAYDPDADLRALQGAHKRKAADQDTYLSKEQLQELRKVQQERYQASKMKTLGMDVPQNMGVRMDGSMFDE